MPEKKADPKKLFPEYVTILGTPWKIVMKDYQDDPYFEKHCANGYCSSPEKEVCVCDNHTWPGDGDETEAFHTSVMKRTLRHELTHAFLFESGLHDSSSRTNCWSRNEEMVDWIALQGPKLYKAWEEAGCLEAMKPDDWVKWKTATFETK